MEPPNYTSRGQQIEALNAQKTKIAEDLKKLVFQRPLQRTHKTGLLQLPKEMIYKITEQFKEKLLFNFRGWIQPLLKLEEIEFLTSNILKESLPSNPASISI